MFNLIFDTGLIPKLWKCAIIKPIPKNSLMDPRIPLNYRGISLLSTVYKMFSSILNRRLVTCLESNNLYAEEQNGFRACRSCLDHIFSLTSIIRGRKAQKKPTFVAYVDMEKAFDRVDRELLFYKLISQGIGGKIYKCLQNLYHDSRSAVDVNGFVTPFFNTDFGVKQGDCISPTLFGVFINDLVKDLKDYECGVDIDGIRRPCLLYADDIALIAESETDLQNMLTILHNWCKKWRMRVNINKSKIVHYRIKSQERTKVDFSFGNGKLEVTEKYKYLGLVLNEFLNYEVTASILAESGGRALGAVYNKFKQIKGLGYNTYTTLYNSGVSPILDYCSGVWGYSNFDKLNTIQNRAIRFFLGVHRFAPNLAINGDMGWVSCNTRKKTEMLKLWNRLLGMENDRLTKKIFLWDKGLCRNNWSSDLKKILTELNLLYLFDDNQMIDVDRAKQRLNNIVDDKWKNDIGQVSKLRTYCTFKNEYQAEPYVKKLLNRGHRSLLAQLRIGILPLRIETGRYQNIPPEFRLCLVCDENVCEDECHFMFHCSLYDDPRQNLYSKIEEINPGFQNSASAGLILVISVS